MTIELLDLLQERAIVHPTRITGVEVTHEQLRLTVLGYPWWLGGERANEGKIVLTFAGIREGQLDVHSFLDMEGDEALETFNVTKLSELGWAEGRSSDAIYCYGPLPDPLRLYAIIEDHLWSVDAPRSARDYLNMPDGSLARFCELTKASLYLVGNTPRYLTEMIMAELLRQNVEHSSCKNARIFRDSIFVRLEGSRFVCDAAWAEF